MTSKKRFDDMKATDRAADNKAREEFDGTVQKVLKSREGYEEIFGGYNDGKEKKFFDLLDRQSPQKQKEVLFTQIVHPEEFWEKKGFYHDKTRMESVNENFLEIMHRDEPHRLRAIFDRQDIETQGKMIKGHMWGVARRFPESLVGYIKKQPNDIQKELLSERGVAPTLVQMGQGDAVLSLLARQPVDTQHDLLLGLDKSISTSRENLPGHLQGWTVNEFGRAGKIGAVVEHIGKWSLQEQRDALKDFGYNLVKWGQELAVVNILEREPKHTGRLDPNLAYALHHKGITTLGGRDGDINYACETHVETPTKGIGRLLIGVPAISAVMLGADINEGRPLASVVNKADAVVRSVAKGAGNVCKSVSKMVAPKPEHDW